MHLAILMTNTDESAFSTRFPKDGEKFTTFIQSARPDWTTDVYAVKDGVFPGPEARFDGVMITGSPASTRSDVPWVGQLRDLICTLHDTGVPMFGACFGHQAIASALGGTVGENPGGWVHGVIPVDCKGMDLPPRVHLCASHCEQVLTLPDGATGYATSPDCPNAGFTLGPHILTTQHHPEMTPTFFAALTQEMTDTLGPDLSTRARMSLEVSPDQKIMAEAVARFYDRALRD